jgi:SAM-dependent methyltransferase
MSRHGKDGLPGKSGLKNLLQPRITPRHIRTIGSDESLLFEAISYNVNKNDRALYNLLHCGRLLNDAARTLGETFSGKTILEIGSSREPGLPLILLLMGCQDYYASNIRKLDDWLPSAYIDLIRLVMSGMLGTPSKNIEEILSWAEGAGANGRNTVGRLREQIFHDRSPVSSENLDLPDGSMDVVFSLAVLEHVRRPQVVIDNIYRMTRPGGWCLHAIDLRDHRDFDNPLDFLKMDEPSYLAERPNGENRWRASDFLDAFSAAGFEIVSADLVDGPMVLNAERNCDMARMIIDPVASASRLEDCSTWVTEEQRATFVPPFSERSLQDLSVLSMTLLLRKPQ